MEIISIFLLIFLVIQSAVICWVWFPLSMKNRQKQPLPEKNEYGKYEEDFKFLHYLIDRERTVAINYVLSPMEVQLDDKLSINDDDVMKIVSDATDRVYNSLIPKYKEHLILNYFGTVEALIQYIVEDIQLFVTSEAIKKNLSRAHNSFIKNKSTAVLNLNDDQRRYNVRTEKGE